MAKRVIAWVIGILLTGLYASTVVAAVGNLLLLPEQAAVAGLGISGFGWFWLVFGVLMPVVVFALSLVIGRRKSSVLRLLVLATGLGVVAVWQLEVALLVSPSSLLTV